MLAFNAPAAPAAAARVAAALGAGDAVDGLGRLHAPTVLKDYGLAEEDLEPAAGLVLAAVPATNPRPVTLDDVRALLRAAWAGTPPTTWDLPS